MKLIQKLHGAELKKPTVAVNSQDFIEPEYSLLYSRAAKSFTS
jgi:hypothetical protein